MAMKVEELQVLISANSDQFKGELLKIQKQLKGLGGTANGISKSVGGNLFGSMVTANIGASLLTGAFSRLSRVTSGFVGEVINGGSQLKRLRIANDTLASNLGITNAQIEDLRDNLAEANTYGTNAENVIKSLVMSGLYQMADGLEAVDARSGDTVKGVTALTLAMKDLAAANSLSSTEGIQRVSKFIQTGNTSFVDGLIELGNLGTEYRMFAQSLGKTRAELTALEEAQARMNIVTREARKVWGAYANTYETSGKAFSSINDLLRRITQSIGAYLEPVLAVSANAIKTFFKGIADFIDASESKIGNVANTIAGYMVALVRLIGTLLSRLPFIGKYFNDLANFAVKPIKQQGKLSDAVGGTGDAMEDMAESTKKAKKELLGLAGFDEMNVLNQDTDSGSGGSGGGAGSGGGMSLGGGGIGEIADSSKEINAIADKVTAKFQRFADAIKKVTDNPIVKFFLNLAKYAGLAFLAFKIGLPIIKLLLSPFAMMVGWVIKMVGVFGVAKGALMGVVGALGAFAAPVLIAVAVIAALVAIFVLLYTQSETFRNSINMLISESLTWIQENIVPIFEQFKQKVLEMVEVFMTKWPEIQKAIEPLIQAIGKFLVDAFKLAGKILDWLWKTILKPVVDFVLANMVPAFSIFLDVLIFIIGTFSKLAATVINLIMPVMNSLWTIFVTVFNAIREVVTFVWRNILQPILKALWSFLIGFVIPVLQNLWAISQVVWNGIRSVVVSVWNSILNAIRPVVQWIDRNIMPVIDKLKNRMSDAFNGIKNTASNIWGGIKGVFKGGINGVIDMVNGFIRKINGLIDKVNDVAGKIPGGQTISFRIGEIPKLARGGIATGATLAQIGEAGTEAVLPLDRNTEWAERVADLLRNANGTGGEGNTIVVQLGNKKIFEQFIDYVNDRSVASNMTVLNV